MDHKIIICNNKKINEMEKKNIDVDLFIHAF